MTQETIEKFNRQISGLKKEVGLLRSFLIGNLLKDREGEYKPEFVKRILKASKEKAEFAFKDGKSFLKQLQKNS